MPNKSASAPAQAGVTMQNNVTGPANGTALDLSGNARGLIYIGHAATPGSGVVTFEISTDGGFEWSAANCVRAASSGDSGSVVNATPAGTVDAVYVVDNLSGPRQVRARISAAFGTAVTISGFRIG